MFDQSLLKLIEYTPTNGVLPLTGVFILIDDGLIAMLRAKLTTNAQRTTFDSWVYRVTEAQAAEYGIPLWSGDTSAVFIRVPATVWVKWSDPVPAQVKTFFAQLYREAA